MMKIRRKILGYRDNGKHLRKDLSEEIYTFLFFSFLFFRFCFCVVVGFSVVSDSQGGDFVSGVLPFSEDSNSQGSEGPMKRLKTVD